jgi:hypothetical protein
MSDFVHTQVMVFIATFKIFTVIWWLSVLSFVIIYQNETKFEIYCNDKTESHHITVKILKVAINTITWVWTK